MFRMQTWTDMGLLLCSSEQGHGYLREVVGHKEVDLSIVHQLGGCRTE